MGIIIISLIIMTNTSATNQLEKMFVPSILSPSGKLLIGKQHFEISNSGKTS